MAVLGVLALALAGVERKRNLDLRLGDVNIIVTTDTHSWLSGHRHADQTPHADADLGDLVSFVDHVREAADREKKDVFFFENGDINDGTGFDLAPLDQGILPLLSKVPYDALNLGNHELYEARSVNAMVDSGYIANWGGRYLSANTRKVGSGDFLGSPYTVVKGKHGTKLLVFGFLFDMPNPDAEAVIVDSPADVVQREWFRETLEKEGKTADAIIVLAHMTAGDELVDTINSAIRSILPQTPVQFLNGHWHRREWRKVDDRSAAFESGANMQCVGFTSFNVTKPGEFMWFESQYIDWNLERLYQITGRNSHSWDTKAGKQIREAVRSRQRELGLLDVVGCQNEAPLLSRRNGVDEKDSLWGLYLKHTIPEGLFHPPRNSSQWFISGTGSLRYDLYGGEVMVDDLITMAPFQNAIHVVRNVPGSAALSVLGSLMGQKSFRGIRMEKFDRTPRWETEALSRWVSTEPLPEGGKLYDVLTVSYDVPELLSALRRVLGDDVTSELYRPELNNGHGVNDTGLWIDWAKNGGLSPPPCTAPEMNCAYCGCTGRCGGCWCNAQCADYGNCCGDYVDVCKRR
eukprot:Hpha_TRINITY_DN15029_c5_g17::TRINITY_DN15029_c5_g17_i1::g.125626::m.125626